MNIVDGYFKQANVENIDQVNNDDRELCRFEFFEILIRIAIGKYVATKREKTAIAGFKRLLTKLVLPYYEKSTHWQRFRDQVLWTYEVNEIFEINLDRLHRLYNLACKREGLRKILSRN